MFKIRYELLLFIWFSNMSKLVQIQYDKNCYNSIRYELLQFNTIRIVTIQYDTNCYNSIRYKLLQFIWFSNISKLVQIKNMILKCTKYDMNCYDSYDFQTCLNLFIIQYDTNWYDWIWYELLRFIWFSNMSKLVQILNDSYDSQLFLNLSKLVLNCNMTKLC